MLFTLVALAAGVGLGLLCAGRMRADRFGRLTRAAKRGGRLATCALMLCIGVWMGGNPAFWESLRTAGLAGVVLALAASAGSVLLCWLAVRLLFSGRAGGGR